MKTVLRDELALYIVILFITIIVFTIHLKKKQIWVNDNRKLKKKLILNCCNCFNNEYKEKRLIHLVFLPRICNNTKDILRCYTDLFSECLQVGKMETLHILFSPFFFEGGGGGGGDVDQHTLNVEMNLGL